MSDDDHLYRVNVKTAASPEEVHAFCELLEDAGYTVVTDLSRGTLDVREGDDE